MSAERSSAPLPPAAFGVGLPARRMVPPPVGARRVARTLAVVAACLAVAALAAPWQQTVTGAGRVVAYAPLDRQQTVEAPIDGRVTRWHAREGSVVTAGALVCELSDNDPELTDRLSREREITSERVETYRARVETLRERLESVQAAQDAAVRSARARVNVAEDRVAAAEQALLGEEADLDAQVVNLARTQVLAEQGLVSRRDLELAVLAEARARTARDGSRASHAAALGEREAARASFEQAEANADAELESARATVASAETDLQGAEASLVRIETRVARQRTQLVYAPRDGTVLRLLANEGGEQVRAGDPLFVLVPDSEDRAVEVWIDGNDASLLTEGRPVRLQFEGWPAVQFAGWPSVAVGTFGGVVAFMDATDDGRGNFRIVVRPNDADDPWPSTRYLRQGVRVNAWVLLNQVSLGFEIWRQLNGFPPTVTPAPSTSPSRASGGSASSYGGSAYGGSGSYGDGADGEEPAGAGGAY